MYKGERIADLLGRIDLLEKTLQTMHSVGSYDELAQGYATLAIAKAKLKSLQGEVKVK